MVGTFWGKKSLKGLPNKVFRFIQQTLSNDGDLPLFMRTGDGNESDKALFGQIYISRVQETNKFR